jgi:hypothetical protein
MNKPSFPCGCELPTSLSRRQFLKATAGGLALSTLAGAAPTALAEETVKKNSSETLVTTFYKSLNDEQKKAICFPFDHPLRLKVDNNWNIVEKRLKDFPADQQQMVREIFRNLHSPEYQERVYKQVEHDSGTDKFEGGTSVALFGEPGTGKFEFVLTGRHCTRRCDGDSVEGAAFGGPIFYGHAAHGFYEKKDHPENAYWFQALQANEVFKSLDGKQRKLALLESAREEKGTDTVKLTGKKKDLPGIPVTELSSDQKDLVRKTLGTLLAPFRKADSEEAMKLIEENGFDALHMAFYKNQDIGEDGVWDVWQIEGPAMLWYFRGEPHVHTWVNIRRSAQS